MIEFAVMPRMELADIVSQIGFDRSMELRRDLQVFLAGRAQKGPKAARINEVVQGDIIQRIQIIEKWCRQHFIYHRMKDLLRTDANKSHIERKRLARAEWENVIIKKWSY